MGYWYGNTHDRADSWHWIGIAISLSQSFGFHRDPGRSNVPLSQRRLWRRIWWCCFYRDRYIALGMGRPTRINPEDCDVAELVVDDLVPLVSLSDLSAGAAATVEKCQKLSTIFLEMLKLAQILGRVLARQYRPRELAPTLADLEILESELQSWFTSMDPIYRVGGNFLRPSGEHHAKAVHRHLVHITYQ